MDSQTRHAQLMWWGDPSPQVRNVAWLRGCLEIFRHRPRRKPRLFVAMFLMLVLADAMPQSPMDPLHPTSPLQGTWVLTFADVLHPDGSRTSDYGSQPKGTLQVDGDGRYTLFIFDGTRPRFAADDKKNGSVEEIRAAFQGSSAHYGQISVDAANHALDFHIEGSTYPNWEGTTQRRRFEMNGDALSYRVPPRRNGDVPLTGWKRISKNH